MNVKFLHNSFKIFNNRLNYLSISAKSCSFGTIFLQKEKSYESVNTTATRQRLNTCFDANYNLVRCKSEKVINNVGKLNCWNCGLTFEKLDLTCPKCDSVIDDKLLKNFNYFELLEEKCKFDFDKKILVQKLRNAQSRLHPDKTVKKSERDRQHSQELSSLMNKAFDTLSDKMLRGLYMLELAGNPLGEETSEMEPGFLEKVMEINELLAKAAEGDFRMMLIQNKEKLENLYQNVSIAFESNDITEAKRLLSQIKFYRNINDKIKKQRYDLC